MSCPNLRVVLFLIFAAAIVGCGSAYDGPVPQYDVNGSDVAGSSPVAPVAAPDCDINLVAYQPAAAPRTTAASPVATPNAAQAGVPMLLAVIVYRRQQRPRAAT